MLVWLHFTKNTECYPNVILQTNKTLSLKFQWQKSFHDHIIRGDDDFGEHWEYIKWNPIKHKMPDNWTYIFTNSKYADLIDYIEL